MSHKCPRPFAAIVLACCAALSAGAQDQQTTEIQGSIHSQQDLWFHGYVVELTELGAQHESWRADVNSDGTFLMRHVPTADYVLRVLTYQGGVITEEFVSVHEHPAVIDVLLPNEDRARPGGTVSVSELQHPPARKAVEAAAVAQKLAASGNSEKAVEQLQKAIRISPQFAAAHSNLAVQYIRMKQYPEARQEIERALGIAGPNAIDLSNLAFLDAVEHRLPEALETVKAALRADPSFPNAHYILGSLLLLDPRTKAEGIRQLEEAAPNIPGAKQMLAHVCAAP